MLNNIQFYSMEQSNNSRYYRSNRSSPELAIMNGIHQHLNNHSYHYHHIPSPPLVQCSAYFISRVDLSNYTLQTLKQTIDNVVSGPKSKGLKVKLSLPDDGLIIDNVPDPNQSWMYRTSELLYFWRDPYYVNIIIVITLNRTNYQRSGPYSATIFRLRGNESVQLFLQRAQQFFAQLSSKNNQKKLFEKSATTEYMPADDNHRHHRKRSRHRSKSQKRSAIRSSPSSKTKSVPPVIHTEFDPKHITTTDSIFNLYNRRTYSETTLSSDTRTSNSKQSNNHMDDDEKMTTVSNYLPTGYYTELVRELKELRNEIAALKLETRITPVRSTSTSPLVVNEVHSKERMKFSQSEMDAQTQTDFSLMNIDKQQLSEKNEIKMDVSNGISVTNKRKNEQSNMKVNKRTYLNGTNNIGSNREESTLVNSSSINGSSNGISSFYPQEGHQPTSYPSKPRPMIINYQNGTTMSKPKIIEKDSSSIPMETESSFSLQTGEVVSFRSSLEDTIAPPENIYENMPIFHPVHSNQSISTNENDQQKGKPYLYVTIAGNHNSETQQQYLSQLFGPQNGISLLIPPESLQNKTNTPSSSSSSIPPETISNNQNYFSHVLFSDHLTNPLFNVDKQLLANTIANQFGIDPNSPDLQKLIANQHLFVTNKRTFANMVWQITPEEASALCSSPVTSNSTIPDISAVDANNPTAKPILKSKASSHLASKGQHISWDTTLD